MKPHYTPLRSVWRWPGGIWGWAAPQPPSGKPPAYKRWARRWESAGSDSSSDPVLRADMEDVQVLSVWLYNFTLFMFWNHILKSIVGAFHKQDTRLHTPLHKNSVSQIDEHVLHLHNNYFHTENLIFCAGFVRHIRKLVDLGRIHLLRRTRRRRANC